MRPDFVASRETEALVAVVEAMSVGEILSFADLAALVGFAVTSDLSAYQSARSIALKRAGIVTAAIRGVGLQRLGAVDTVHKADRHLTSIRRRARHGQRELAAAIKGNLDPDTTVEALRKQAMFGLIETSTHRPRSNARPSATPATAPVERPGLDSIPGRKGRAG